MRSKSNYRLRLAIAVALCMSGLPKLGFGQGGYQQPNFTAMGMGGGQASAISQAYPASPLAGGPAAMQGGEYIDVQGRDVVVQAQYAQGYPSGFGGGGDPMAIDFGGYGQDQVGPHYFDVGFESVFLVQADGAGEGLPAFSSFGNGNAPGETMNPFLDPNGEGEDLSPGWRVAVRADVGALAVLEATYTGLYDLGFQQTVNSADIDPMQPNQLFSIFSNYGFIDQDGGDGIDGLPGLDEASQHTLNYESDLQTTEFSYRRYWVGQNPRISGTYMAGFRYTRLTEDFMFSAVTLDGNGTVGTFTENDLLGFQFGGDGWIGLRQGLRVGFDGKAGVYNNRYKFNTAITDVGATEFNVQPDAEGNQVAFITEGRVSFVADILPSWSLKGGYEFLYLNSLVTVQGNVNTVIYDDTIAAAPTLGTEGHVFYHGFHGGIEYVW